MVVLLCYGLVRVVELPDLFFHSVDLEHAGAITDAGRNQLVLLGLIGLLPRSWLLLFQACVDVLFIDLQQEWSLLGWVEVFDES